MLLVGQQGHPACRKQINESQRAFWCFVVLIWKTVFADDAKFYWHMLTVSDNITLQYALEAL